MSLGETRLKTEVCTHTPKSNTDKPCLTSARVAEGAGPHKEMSELKIKLRKLLRVLNKAVFERVQGQVCGQNGISCLTVGKHCAVEDSREPYILLGASVFSSLKWGCFGHLSCDNSLTY